MDNIINNLITYAGSDEGERTINQPLRDKILIAIGLVIALGSIAYAFYFLLKSLF